MPIPNLNTKRLPIRHGGWASGVLFAFLVLTLVSSALAQSDPASASGRVRVLDSNENHVVLELVTGNYTVRPIRANGQVYAALSVPGFGQTGDPGAPQIPIRGVMVGIPPSAQVTVRVLDDESRGESLASPPPPAPSLRVQSDPLNPRAYSESPVASPDARAYASAELYPRDSARLVSTGTWRSQPYALVEFHPFQYRAVGRQLVFHSTLRVEVQFNYPNGRAESSRIDEGPFEQILQGAIVNYDSARNWRIKPAIQPFQAASHPTYAGGPWYRIAVSTDGIYHLTCSDLASAGVSTSTLDPATLQLFKLGTELAIGVQGASWQTACDSTDYIEFFGQAPTTVYSNTNIYWLTFGTEPGKRMATPFTSGGTLIQSFADTIHLEQNRLRSSAYPLVQNADHWFWDYVSGTSAHNYTFQMDRLAAITATATIKYDVTGYTTGQHRTQIKVNGTLIQDDNGWTGSVEHVGAATFSQSLLKPLTNTVTLSEAANSALFLNWFDVNYTAAFKTSTDVLRFAQPTAGAWQYQLTGFSKADVSVFDISDPQNVRQLGNLTTSGTGPFTIQFSDTITSTHTYLALTGAKRNLHPAITLDTPSNLHDTSNGADEIIISYGGFIHNIQPLANYRAAQGLRVQVVDAQDVYDEFGDGVQDPQAIHDFLQYAYSNWSVPPSFVLLVGDGTYDPKGYCGVQGFCLGGLTTPPNSTLIPPFLQFVDPWLGEVASDNRLVALDPTSTLPTMSIGRLPAGTAQDVDVMVAKILNYEQNPPSGAWRNQVTFVSDAAYDTSGASDSAGNFWAMSDAIASNSQYLPAPLTANRIYYNPCDPAQFPQCALPYTPYTTASAAEMAIDSAINNGAVIVNYVGHGAPTLWSNGSIFTTSDATGLTNGSMTPFMIDMTCLTGYFTDPGYAGLSETLVRKSGGGAVASWAATGFGVGAGHDLLDQGFFGAMMQQGITRVGLATDFGKLNLWMNGGGANRDLIDTFIMMGDPATRLALPAGASPTPSSSPTNTMRATPTDTATATESPTEIETVTPTSTATATPTDTATATETSTPTATPTAVVTSLDDRDPQIRYDSWIGIQDAGASGGSYRSSRATGALAHFTFTGTTVTWVTIQGPDQGKAQVKVDGVVRATSDLYSAGIQHNVQRTYAGLKNGTHTLDILVAGSKNARSTDYKVSVDRLVVGTKTVEDTAASIQYDNWSGKNSPSAYAGTYHANATAGATVTLAFKGTRIQWITVKGPSYGKANVILDGISQGNFDLYSSTAKWQTAIRSSALAPGTHTLTIKVLGTHNLASTGSGVVVDGFIYQ